MNGVHRFYRRLRDGNTLGSYEAVSIFFRYPWKLINDAKFTSDTHSLANMKKRDSHPRVGSLPVELASEDPVVALRKEKTGLERELGKLQRELDLVKGKSEVKVAQLEEALFRANQTLTQLKSDISVIASAKQTSDEELQLLHDSIIDQANEVSALKARQLGMDQEMHRKDKDAQELMIAVRRYKTRVDYLKSKLRRASALRRSSFKSEEDGSSITVPLNGSIAAEGDQSPFTGGASSLMSASIPGGRRDSIPFPGYMTSEEEYFRLVLLAAKLNVASQAGSATPSTVHDTMSVGSGNEVTETEFEPKLLYAQIVLEQVPFHKWHEWAQDYITTHRMPTLMGVERSRTSSKSGEKKTKLNIVQRVARSTQQILIRIFPRRHKQSIGVAAGGEWEEE
jgi:hypothetical protein